MDHGGVRHAASLHAYTHCASRPPRASRPGRTQEIQRLIGRSLRAVADLRALGERTITIDCDVLQADGGTRTASVTGGYVALADAIEALMRRRVLTSSPLHGQVAAGFPSASAGACRCSTLTTPKILKPRRT